MNKELDRLATPAVVVELDTAERNIRHMVNEAKSYGLKHRPHVKTHRCGYLANLQIQYGCTGVTTAKLGEAEVMADNGIPNIFIAYPLIGEDKIKRLLALDQRAKLSTIVNSEKGAKALSDAFEKEGKSLSVLIEIDGGVNRGGIKPGEAVLRFADRIRHLKGLDITGLMYYGGLIYASRNRCMLEECCKKEREELLMTSKLLKQNGYSMSVLSAGSSFSGKLPWLLEGITEIRCGHYIFNDCGQLDMGLARPEDCALFVITTVVAKPDAHAVICDVGTKTLTGDLCHYRKGYGYVIDYPEAEIYSLNEEHAFLRFDGINPLQIGDKIALIPNHACVITNLAERVYGFRGGRLERMLTIDAKGKSV